MKNLDSVLVNGVWSVGMMLLFGLASFVISRTSPFGILFFGSGMLFILGATIFFLELPTSNRILLAFGTILVFYVSVKLNNQELIRVKWDFIPYWVGFLTLFFVGGCIAGIDFRRKNTPESQ